MVMVKKSASGGGAPSLDILAAKLRIAEAELTLEEKEVRPDKGAPFMAEPNLNCLIEVVKNLVNPTGGLLVQARGLDCASGEPILRQNLGVFMGIKQAWLKVSLTPFLAPTKYR